MPLDKCHNILVVRTDRIGDVVLTTPVFKALRLAFPLAKISVLVAPLTVDLVSGNPYVDEVLVDDRAGRHKGVWGALHLARAIRQRHFDTAFILHTKRRYNVLCFLAGIPRRIGYKNNKMGILLTDPLKDDRALGHKHEAQYCLDVLAAVGIAGAGLDLFVPSHKDAEEWATAWLQKNSTQPGQVIAIHPGASDPTKIWPAQSFARLVNALMNRYAFKIVLIGGAETRAIAAEILAATPAGVVDLTGQLGIGQMASVLRRARLLISNDSGPVHVGAGVGIHVISLFLRDQPGINPERWRPLGNKAFMLANKPGEAVHLDQQARKQGGKHDSIAVDEVVDLIEQIMTRNTQSVFYW